LGGRRPACRRLLPARFLFCPLSPQLCDQDLLLFNVGGVALALVAPVRLALDAAGRPVADALGAHDNVVPLGVAAGASLAHRVQPRSALELVGHRVAGGRQIPVGVDRERLGAPHVLEEVDERAGAGAFPITLVYLGPGWIHKGVALGIFCADNGFFPPNIGHPLIVAEAASLGRQLEDAGADALTFHPRVPPDRRTRPAKWEYIGMVKQAVGIPVFGNGDVLDQNDCLKMLTSTGCDGVAIGRLAIAKPWIFAEWTGNMESRPEVYFESAIKLANLLQQYFDPGQAIRRFKRFTYYFSANFKFGHTFYTRVSNAKDMAAVIDCINAFFKNPPECGRRPNLNYFS